jgi:8-amino-7-oxononanoate synthase
MIDNGYRFDLDRTIDLRRPDPFAHFASYDVARRLQRAGMYPYFRPLDHSEGTVAVMDGHRVLMFGSNNYLGLTTDSRVRQAAAAAVVEFGTSCTGSRFLNGTLDAHIRLQEDLADWVGKEAALVFSTGMQANLGAISAIAGRHSVLFLDASDHASIIDGARLGHARNTIRFKHQNVEDLERRIDSVDSDMGVIVVVDGVYSMEGEIADLPRLVDVVRRAGGRLVVDDAHGLGTVGGGRGTGFHFGIQDEIDLVIATFSKSLASIGGFVAGDVDTIHYIQHNARSMMFSAALPPGDTAAAQMALNILRSEPERVVRLQELAHRLRSGLVREGFKTIGEGTPVVPVIVGEDTKTFLMWQELLDRGVYVNPVVAPAVPDGLQLLRMSVMATQEEADIDHAIEALVDARRVVASPD